MPLRFTVLASGSGGNASLLEAGGFGVLIDVGLGPRQLARRLAAAGVCWAQVQAVLLTHTHSDHWNDRTLGYLRRLRIPLYCHASHHEALLDYGAAFAVLCDENLVRAYEPDRELELVPGLCCRPLPLRHDGGITCGFRFEAAADAAGQRFALGYVADLGSWGPDLAQTLGDVDLLALEFNHDVALERSSGRSPRLIARILGDDGHLSNFQAATLLREVLRRSAPDRLRQVVQLHLSRDCNHPDLAWAAADAALCDHPYAVAVHTAAQHTPSPTFDLGIATNGAAARIGRPVRGKQSGPEGSAQPWLPGMGID
jgi:phosphoribosyl 1,2-cyclic phosphodiesterase